MGIGWVHRNLIMDNAVMHHPASFGWRGPVS